MKAFGILILTVLAAAGVFAGLLYARIVPAASIAQSSQLAATALETVGLYSPATSTALPPMAAATPASTESAAKAQTASAPVQVKPARRRAVAAHKIARPVASSSPVAPADPVEAPLSEKLADIYNTMKADNLAAIFQKQPDSEVVRALTAMDEGKAGKVLAVMPPDRAARITAILGRPDPPTSPAPAQ